MNPSLPHLRYPSGPGPYIGFLQASTGPFDPVRSARQEGAAHCLSKRSFLALRDWSMVR